MVDENYELQWGKHPKTTVDSFVMMGSQILVIQRKDGLWALPGGFLEPGERLLAGAMRETLEETNINLNDFDADPMDDVHFIGTFYNDDPDRDPRTHIITHVHMWVCGNIRPHWAAQVQAGDDAVKAEFIDLFEVDNREWYAQHDMFIETAILQTLKYLAGI